VGCCGAVRAADSTVFSGTANMMDLSSWWVAGEVAGRSPGKTERATDPAEVDVTPPFGHGTQQHASY
jgi:hypothetical protein